MGDTQSEWAESVSISVRCTWLKWYFNGCEWQWKEQGALNLHWQVRLRELLTVLILDQEQLEQRRDLIMLTWGRFMPSAWENRQEIVFASQRCRSGVQRGSEQSFGCD